jgi:hypothetical protein
VFYQKNNDLANSKDTDQSDLEFLENTRAAIEDFSGSLQDTDIQIEITPNRKSYYPMERASARSAVAVGGWWWSYGGGPEEEGKEGSGQEYEPHPPEGIEEEPEKVRR